MSLSYDYVLQKDAYNGLMTKAISRRYVLSALPIYQATLSLLSDGLHHLVITHNLFPLFYIINLIMNLISNNVITHNNHL